MNERVFVDTSTYYALADQDDNNHGNAQTMSQRLSHERADLYTTNFVAAETHTLLLNRLGRHAAARVLERLYTSSTRIVRATEADERRARAIISQYADKDFSLVDTISFAVIERLHLHRAWTYDHHFAQFGISEVR